MTNQHHPGICVKPAMLNKVSHSCLYQAHESYDSFRQNGGKMERWANGVNNVSTRASRLFQSLFVYPLISHLCIMCFIILGFIFFFLYICLILNDANVKPLLVLCAEMCCLCWEWALTSELMITSENEWNVFFNFAKLHQCRGFDGFLQHTAPHSDMAGIKGHHVISMETVCRFHLSLSLCLHLLFFSD